MRLSPWLQTAEMPVRRGTGHGPPSADGKKEERPQIKEESEYGLPFGKMLMLVTHFGFDVNSDARLIIQTVLFGCILEQGSPNQA